MPMRKWLTAVAMMSMGISVQATRPNFVIIMCDDLGYADVGFTGAPDIRTPEIDKLAAAGVVCTSGYVTHPFCGPSRMGLLSGRYPHAFGGQYNLPPKHLGIEEYNRLGIPESETLISKVLQDAGYFTGAVGKWHLGEEDEYHPNNRGFDDFYGFLGGGHNYFPEQYRAAYENQKRAGKTHINDYLHPLEHNGKPTREDEYLTDELSMHAVRFLKQAAGKNQPFFLYLSYNAPHSPMQAKEEDMAPYAHITDPKRRVVAGMMAAVDRGVGHVVETLKRNGQYDNTLIIFLSDNGGKPSMGSSNAPLRGAKGDIWEGGFRVPFFFHWPAKLQARTFDHPVTSLDFYPTFAALAGAAIPKGKVLNGEDIMDALRDGADPRKGEPIFAMRHWAGYSDVSARRGDWKLVRQANKPWRLYDVQTDPGETHDRAAEYPERARELLKVAEGWSRTHVDPLWFHARNAAEQWAGNEMPRFDRTFDPDIGGAPPFGPVVHITDKPVIPAIPAPPGVVLKKGDSTLEQYVAREKAKWESKGWPWNQDRVEANFRKIDTNGDGIITGKEKKAFYQGGSPAPTKAKSASPSVNAQLKKGDSTLEQFVAREKIKWEKNGWPWDRAKVEANFRKMDTNGDGIASGKEKKAYWSGQ